MSDKSTKMLRVGDYIEFHCSGYPYPPDAWELEEVKEIRIVDDFDDKEGVTVEKVSWREVAELHCLVVVLGTEHWGRNDEIRPAFYVQRPQDNIRQESR